MPASHATARPGTTTSARGLHTHRLRAQPRDQQRSDLAGWATYGYSASHSRWFWGLRLHLLATPAGLPIAFALTGAKADERDTCLDMIAEAGVTRRAQTLIADKGYRSAAFEQQLADAGITLIRPATTTEPARGGQRSCDRPPDHRIDHLDLKAQLGLDATRRTPRRRRARPATTPRPPPTTLTTKPTQKASPARSLLAYDTNP